MAVQRSPSRAVRTCRPGRPTAVEHRLDAWRRPRGATSSCTMAAAGISTCSQPVAGAAPLGRRAVARRPRTLRSPRGQRHRCSGSRPGAPPGAGDDVVADLRRRARGVPTARPAAAYGSCGAARSVPDAGAGRSRPATHLAVRDRQRALIPLAVAAQGRPSPRPSGPVRLEPGPRLRGVRGCRAVLGDQSSAAAPVRRRGHRRATAMRRAGDRAGSVLRPAGGRRRHATAERDRAALGAGG